MSSAYCPYAIMKRVAKREKRDAFPGDIKSVEDRPLETCRISLPRPCLLQDQRETRRASRTALLYVVGTTIQCVPI